MLRVGLISRAAQMVALWAGLSFGLFVVVHAMPGSPEQMLLATNPELSAADMARIRDLRGLDLPVPTRYRCWLFGRSASVCPHWPTEGGLMTGELGWSSAHQRPVAVLLAQRLPNTLMLMVPTFLLSLLGAIALGLLAATRPGSGWDRAAQGVATVGLALPAHWLGLVAILVFAVGLGWFPSGGVDRFDAPGWASRGHHAALPVLVLSVYYLGRWTRYVRGALLEELGKPHLDAARAKGLSERQVILRHVIPNALYPLLTVVAQSTPVLFSGALVIERVFAYPGMGLLIFESVDDHDYLVAVTVFLIYAALTFGAAALADIGYLLLDPRARVGGRSE